MANTKQKKIDELSAALLEVIEAPVPVHPTYRISKSKFMAGLQCPKREYLQVRHPELAVSVDDGLKQHGITGATSVPRWGACRWRPHAPI
jgi:hypothetical protein